MQLNVTQNKFVPLAFLVYFQFSSIAHDIEGDYDTFPDHKTKNPSESM